MSAFWFIYISYIYIYIIYALFFFRHCLINLFYLNIEENCAFVNVLVSKMATSSKKWQAVWSIIISKKDIFLYQNETICFFPNGNWILNFPFSFNVVAKYKIFNLIVYYFFFYCITFKYTNLTRYPKGKYDIAM